MSVSTPLLITVRDAAQTLAISTTKIYELAGDGVLVKRYIGKGTRNFRLTYESVQAYAESLPQDPIEGDA